MSFGPVTIAMLETMDIQAPGAPGLAARQVSNSEGKFTLTPPTTDADGSPLTGLTFRQVAVIQTTPRPRSCTGTTSTRSCSSTARRSSKWAWPPASRRARRSRSPSPASRTRS